MLIALDTSTSWASVALFDGRQVLAELTWRSHRRSGDELFPMLERALSLGDSSLSQVDRIAVDIRLQYGFAISRAELIRALIEAAAQSGVVLSDASNIKEMIAMLSEAWAGAKTRKKRSGG